MKIFKNILFSLLLSIAFCSCQKRASACFDYQQTDSLTVSFDASCSKNTYTYSWDFNFTNVKTTDSKIIYKFEKPGTYNVILVALNKKGKHGGFGMEIPKMQKKIVVY